MDYLDPAAPTCPHLHTHTHAHTHTHIHTHTRTITHIHTHTHTHLNTLLACEPQVTTVNEHFKVTQSPHDVSKQLHFDDDEDTQRLVKLKKSEQKKKAKQKTDEYNGDGSEATKTKKKGSKKSDKTPAKDGSENIESSTTPSYKRTGSNEAIQDAAVAMKSTAALISETSTSAIETGDTFQLMLQAALDTATLMGQRPRGVAYDSQ